MSANYATHERVRQLAEDLHHEARPERIYAILGNALEKAYKFGWDMAGHELDGYNEPKQPAYSYAGNDDGW